MGTTQTTADAAARDRRIRAAVAAIPRGRVASYDELLWGPGPAGGPAARRPRRAP